MHLILLKTSTVLIQFFLYLQSANLTALGIVGGSVTIGNAANVAAPIAKKRPSTSTLGTIAINDIIATRTHPIPVSEGSVTVSVVNQENQKGAIGTGRIGYGMLYIFINFSLHNNILQKWILMYLQSYFHFIF